MPPQNDEDQISKLIAVIQEAIQRDEQLREKYAIGEKFRFIRDRLHLLLEDIKKESSNVSEAKQNLYREIKVGEDELLVYVHLYNAQGLLLRTWQSIITPKAFFDFGVNRPIYKEKPHVETFIRAKPNKAQHGYLTIAMKRERIHPGNAGNEDNLKDPMGHPLIKVREGSLLYERMVSFTHNEQEYILSNGELVKKIPA